MKPLYCTIFYMTDNLPQEFEITSYSLNLNGEPITNYFSGPLFNQVIPDYITYRWVIDNPSPNDDLNHFVDPDDSLELMYKIICRVEDDYTLPFHTLCFYGNLTGFFTTSDSINISVFEDNPFGFITGVVTDIESIPIEGVYVQAIDTEIDDSSNADGQYMLNNLQSGSYDILFTHPDFENVLYHDIFVDASDTTILNMVLNEPGDCYYIPGDINGDSRVIGGDVTYGVNYFIGLGNSPPDSCWNDSTMAWLYSAADVNGDCLFIGSDITCLVNYFCGGDIQPSWCPQTPPANPGLLRSAGQLNPSNILSDP